MFIRKIPSVHAALAELSRLIDRGGPEPQDYPEVHALMESVHPFLRNHEHEIRALQAESRGAFNSRRTLQGHVCLKPYGYHGDFEIIDRIYQEDTATEPHLANWDRFFHWTSGSVAVRNRKAFFRTVLGEAMVGRSACRVLNLASGPCRDLSEALAGLSEGMEVQVDCVDNDPRSIDYARAVVGLTRPTVAFHRQNALRFASPHSYDLIWSAGLFDYLDDRLFVLLLKRLSRKLAEGGRMFVGNFGEENPHRSYMEFGGWELIHRSPERLLALAGAAGFAPSQCAVSSEPSGVNLFLRLERD